MDELKFYIKKLRDLPYQGEWKSIYSNLYEKVHPFIYHSYFIRKNIYLNEIERLNEEFMDLPFVHNDEERLHFRKIQKQIIDLLYKVQEETKKIFIIHGRDSTMSDKVATLLGKLKLDFVLIDYDSEEERKAKDFNKIAKECDYAIALFSADDLGKESTGNANEKYRVSQNVIFQLGYFLSHVGRKNMVILYSEDKEIESPINFDGFAHAPYDKSGKWKKELVKVLSESGIYIHKELADKI